MPRVNSTAVSRYAGLAFTVTALLVVAADQLSKLLIRNNMVLGESIPETGFIRIHHVQNTGAAFGLFPDHTFALTIIGFIGVAATIVAFFFSDRLPPLSGRGGKIALGMILGGVTGNLIDRLRLEYVTDFIDIGIWPTFNLADPAVIIGVLILIYLILFPAKGRISNGQGT